MYGYQGSNSQPYSYQNPNGSSYGNIGQYTGPYNPYYSNASAAYNAYPSNDQQRSSLGVLPQEYSPVGNGIPPPYFFDPNNSYPRQYQGLPFNQSMEIPIANSYDSCPRNCHCCESMKPKYFPPNNSIHLQANNQSTCDSSINGTYNGLRKGLNSGIWRDQLPSFQGPNDSSPSWSLPKCGTTCKTEPYAWPLTQRQTGKFEGMEHLPPKVSNTCMLSQQHQRKALSNNQTVLNSNSLLPPPSTRPSHGRSDEHMGSCFSGYQYSSSDFQKNIPETDIYSKQYVNKIPASSKIPCNISNNFGGGFSYKFSTPNSKNSQENQKCNGDSPKLVTPLPSAIVDSMQRRLPPNNLLDGTNETAYCQPGIVPTLNPIDGSSRRSYDVPTDSNSRFPVSFSSSTSGDPFHSRLPHTSVQSFRPSSVISKLSHKNCRADFSHLPPPRMHGKTEYERECRSNANSDNLPSSDLLKNLCLMNSERARSLISSENTSKVSLGHGNDCLPLNHGVKSASVNAATLLTEEVNKHPNCKDIALKPLSGSDSAVIRDLRHFLTTWDDGDDDETNSVVLNNHHTLGNDCAPGDFMGGPRTCPTVDYPIGKADDNHINLCGNSPDDVRELKEASSGTGEYESIVSYKEFNNTSGNRLFNDQPCMDANIANGTVDDLNITQQTPDDLRKHTECTGMKPDINTFHSDAELKPRGTFDESLYSPHPIINPQEINGITADVMMKDYIKNDSSIILSTSLENCALKEKLEVTKAEEESTENQDTCHSSSSEAISPGRTHSPPEGHHEGEMLNKLCINAEVIPEKCNEEIPCLSKEESGMSKLAESRNTLLKKDHEICRDTELSDISVVSNPPNRSSHETNDALISHSSSTKIIGPQKFAEASDVCSWVKIDSNESIAEKYPEGMNGEMKDIVEFQDITNFEVRSSCEVNEENLNSVNDECHETDQLIQMKEHCSETNMLDEGNTASAPGSEKNLLRKEDAESSDGDQIIPVENKVLTDELPPSVEYSLHGNLLHENSHSVSDDHEENHLRQNSKLLRENVMMCKSEVLSVDHWQTNKESKMNSSSLSPCRDETIELKDTKNKKGCRIGRVNIASGIIKKLSCRAALLIVRKYLKIKLKNKMRLRDLRGGRKMKSGINRRGILVLSKKQKYYSKKKNFFDDFRKQQHLKIISRVNGIKTQKINSNTGRCLMSDPMVLAGNGVDVEGPLNSVCDSDTKVNHSNENSRQTESYGEQNTMEYPDYNHIEEFPIENPTLLDLLPPEERGMNLGSYESNLLIRNKEVFMGIGGDVDSFEEAAERENVDNELHAESCLHEDATNGYYWSNYEIGNDLGVAMEIVVGSDTQSGDNLDLKQDLIGKVNVSGCPDYKEPEEFIQQKELERNFNKAHAVGDESTHDDLESHVMNERIVIGSSSVKAVNENESMPVELSSKDHIGETDSYCSENVINRLNESNCKKEIKLLSCSLSEKDEQSLNTCSESLEPKCAIIEATVNKCHNEFNDLDIEKDRLPGSPGNDINGASDSEVKCVRNVSEMSQQKVCHSQIPEKSTWSEKSIMQKRSTCLKSCKEYRTKLGNAVNPVPCASSHDSDCKSGVSHNHTNVDSDSTLNVPFSNPDVSNLCSAVKRKESSSTKSIVHHLGLSSETNMKNDGVASIISCHTGVYLKNDEGMKKKVKYINDKLSITKESGLKEIIPCSSSKPLVLENEVNFSKEELLKEESKNKVIAKAKLRKKNKLYCYSKDVTIKHSRDARKKVQTSSSSVAVSQCMDLERVPVKENSPKEPQRGPYKINSFRTKASLKCFDGFRLMPVQYHRRGFWKNKKWPYKKIKSQQYLLKNTSKVPRLPAPELYSHSLPHILGLCTAFPPPPLSPLPVVTDVLSTSCSPHSAPHSNLNSTDCPLQSDDNDGNHVNGVSDTLTMADQHSSDTCEINLTSVEPTIPECQTHQEDRNGVNSKEDIISAVVAAPLDPLESTLPVCSNENTNEFSKLSQATISPGCGAPIVESSSLGSRLDNVQPIDEVIGIPIKSHCSNQNSSNDLTSSNPETPPHVCITLKKIGCVDKKKVWRKRQTIKNNPKNLQDFDKEEVKKMGSSEGESPVPKVTIKKKSGEMGYQSFLSGFSSASPSPSRSPTITSKPEFPPHTPLSGEDTSTRKCSEVLTKSFDEKSATGDSSPLMTDVKSDHHSQGSEHLRKNDSASTERTLSKSLVEKKEGNGLKFVIRGLGDKLKEYSVKELGAQTELSPSKESNNAQNNSLETSEYSVTSGDDGWESGPWSIWQPVVKLSRSCELDALARELNSMDEDNGSKPAHMQGWRRVKKIRHSSKKRNEQYRSCGNRDGSISVTDKVKGHMKSIEKLGRIKCDEDRNSKMMFSRKICHSGHGTDNEEPSKIQSAEHSHHLLPQQNKKLKSESSLNDLQSIKKPLTGNIRTSYKKEEGTCESNFSRIEAVRKTSRDGREILKSHPKIIKNSTKEVSSGNKSHGWPMKNKSEIGRSSIPNIPTEKISSSGETKDKKKRTWDNRVKEKYEQKNKQETVQREKIVINSEAEKEVRCKESSVLPYTGSKVRDLPSNDTLSNILEDNIDPKSKENCVKNVSYKIQVPQKEDLPAKKRVCGILHPERCSRGHTFSCEACSRKFSSQKWLSRHCKGVSHSRVENAQRQAVQALMLLFTGNESSLLQPLSEKEHTHLRNWSTHAVPSPLQLALKEFLNST